MRVNLSKSPQQIAAEQEAAEQAQEIAEVKYDRVRDILDLLVGASPEQIDGKVQNLLGGYPPTAQQWNILLKIITFILIVLKVLIKRSKLGG